MTIHKSKGLQYDHVIIPQLNGKSRSNDKDLVILHNRLNRRGVARLFIAALPDPGNETGGNKQPDDTLYEFVKGEHKQKDLYEETRLIYIAMTRAKHSVSLYATLPENTDKEGNAKALAPANNCLLARIWEPLLGLSDFSPAQIAIGAPTKNTPVESADHFPAITPIKRFRTVCRVSEDQMRIITEQLAPTLAEEKANEDTQDKERQLSKLLGTLSHAFLEAFCLSAFDPEVTLHALAPRWRRKLIRLGVDEAQAEARIVETQRELLRCLNGSNRWVFDSVGVQAECELKLATSERQGDEEYHKHRVVDRTLVVNEERWIIDFKTSHKHEAQTEEEFIASQKEEYRPQLESYGELFRGFEDTPQRLALLLTSIDALVEL
jgi:ATP-dependent exoDNAse (exonuclease V) beta subunit